MQFLKMPYELITDKSITANEFRIYTYLLSLYNAEKKCCFPSLDVISERLGICLSTVKKSIKNLAKLNYIVIEKRKGLAGNFNVYKKLKHIMSNITKKAKRQDLSHNSTIKDIKNKLFNKTKINNKDMNIEEEYIGENIDSHINVRLARSVTNVDNSSFAKKILSLANENIVREAIKIFKRKRGKTPTFLINLIIDEYCRRKIDFPLGMFNLLKSRLMIFSP
ncbi:MAG: helix-turn-helix domain-containing protein [Clostridium perfringens]|nr:helix-turn-helix domain-containing protein [Clostridium perfringens]